MVLAERVAAGTQDVADNILPRQSSSCLCFKCSLLVPLQNVGVKPQDVMQSIAGCRAQAGRSLSRESSGSDFMESPSPSASSPMPKMNLHLGVLHYSPLRCAPLLDSPTSPCLSPHVDPYSILIKAGIQPKITCSFGVDWIHHEGDVARYTCDSVVQREPLQAWLWTSCNPSSPGFCYTGADHEAICPAGKPSRC